MRDANDKFTSDLLGGHKPRGRKRSGMAISATERSRRFRKNNQAITLNKAGFLDGYRAGIGGEDGTNPDVDDIFSWRMGWLVANKMLPRTVKIDELLRDIENDL